MANALPMLFVIAGGLCLMLVLLAFWHSVRGLVFRGAVTGSSPRAANRERLLHEKQELLTAIRDVRMEHELGKVSDADFARLEQEYRARAREVLRELDEQLAPHRANAQQVLAQALGNASAASTAAAAPLPIATAAQAATPGDCGRCGTVNDVDAVFCKKCGERLSPELRP
jgi:hypothetical protein